VAKELSYDEVASRKDKAESFVRDILQGDERADEIAEEDVGGLRRSAGLHNHRQHRKERKHAKEKQG
jgi:hypothetical protein